jgi:hypothetical protein
LKSILENRLIAYLDVLGFSALLESKQLIEVHEIYSGFIDTAKNATFYTTNGDNSGRTNFEYAKIFSDSIILVSNKIDDIYNVNNFIAAVSYLLEIGFVSKMPLRGAIAKGDFLIDLDRDIFLSKEFAQVVRFEGNQNWTGCSIMESAVQVVLEAAYGENYDNSMNKNTLCNDPLHYYPVPTKDSDSIKMPVINFMFFFSNKQIDDGLHYLIGEKQKNNSKYYEYLKSLPCERQPLEKEFEPAKYLSVMKTRSGMRALFMDENLDPCNPNIENFTWIAVGRWK